MGMGDEDLNPVKYPGDPLKIIQQEQQEFAKMNDGIRDIDWYKAETEAARNGQTAAMEFADAKKKEAAKAKRDLAEAKDQVDDLKVALLTTWGVALLLIVVLLILIGVMVS